MSKLDKIFMDFCNEVATICPEFKDYIPHLVDSDENAGERFRQQIKKLILDQLNGAQSNLRREYELNRSQRHGMDMLSEEIRQKVKVL